MTSPSPGPDQSRRLSGRWVVLGMFAFGLTAVGTLYLYWRLHTAPFLPLQQALADRFPGSRPLVEGGQRKIHEGTPRILRITMEVDSDPNHPGSEQRFSQLADEVLAIAQEHAPLERYETLELYFFWPDPEKEIHQRQISYSLGEHPQRVAEPD